MNRLLSTALVAAASLVGTLSASAGSTYVSPASPAVKELSRITVYWTDTFEVRILDPQAITVTHDGEPMDINVTTDTYMEIYIDLPKNAPTGDYHLSIPGGTLRVDYEIIEDAIERDWVVTGDIPNSECAVSFNPPSGTEMKRIHTFSITFDGIEKVLPLWQNGPNTPYAIMWGGNRNYVLPKDVTVEGNTATLSLRSPIADPETYPIVIPEGAFLLDDCFNPEYRIEYTVLPLVWEVGPEGDQFEQLDAVTLTFPDYESVTLTEDGSWNPYIYDLEGNAIWEAVPSTQGNTLTVSYPGGFPEGEYIFSVFAGSIAIDGSRIEFSMNDLKQFTVKKEQHIELDMTVLPEQEEHDTLSDITIIFGGADTVEVADESAWFVERNSSPLLAGNITTEGNVLSIKYNSPLTDGLYNVVIKKKSVLINGELLKEGLGIIKTYYVQEGLGVRAFEADENVRVYSVDGTKVFEGEAQRMANELPAGLYIINGKKVSVR